MGCKMWIFCAVFGTTIFAAVLTTVLVLTLGGDDEKETPPSSPHPPITTSPPLTEPPMTPTPQTTGNKLLISSNGEVQVIRNGTIVLEGDLGTNLEGEFATCDPGGDPCMEWPGKARLQIGNTSEDDIICHHYSWGALSDDIILRDCYEMNPAHWYGSAEMFYQHWPIIKQNKSLENYVSGDLFNDEYGSVLERYWLSSRGVAIRVSHDSPLHVSINEDQDGKLCFVGTYDDSYYPNPQDKFPTLDYTLCTGNDVRHVHEYMSATYVSKPTGCPDERMIKSPIWSTWAQFKVYINESEIIDYAWNIKNNGFNNSQLEIDDGFQLKYGDFDFDPEKFSNVSGMVEQLHQMGFRVTLWTTPFANINSDAFAEGDALGYWVKNSSNVTGRVSWWNGVAGMLDVTNPAARDWFVERLEEVREELGIDSFKFDAGETNYLARNFATHEQLVNPCEYTTEYVKMCARLGDQIEVRVGFQNQDQPIFVRMMDKESHWGIDNGLKTLITTALTFNILGYPYVLPDMIGGNVYDDGFHSTTLPSRYLFIRWLEVTAFLPSMQYSISPWQYDDEVIEIALRWTAFHENVITPILLRIIKDDVVTQGKPLNPPIWWIAPEDPEALQIDDQFMVGEEILVAPVVSEGMDSRDVYLPAGKWYDHLNGDTIEGGMWLLDVAVPLDEVAYYTRVAE